MEPVAVFCRMRGIGGLGRKASMIDVLLVEDDEFIAKTITYYLEGKRSCRVHCAGTSGEALGLARGSFDVILLDVLLPDADGIGLCKRLRQWHDCPIIFISCLDDSETIIKALDAGADDFVTKPFDNDVLNARIEANMRRVAADRHGPAPENVVACGPFKLDARSGVLEKGGEAISLPPLEFKLLAFLMQNTGRCFTSKELYRRVWGKDSFGDARTVIVHIHHIRTKIGDDSQDPRFIKNVWGKGYTFSCDGECS